MKKRHHITQKLAGFTLASLIIAFGLVIFTPNPAFADCNTECSGKGLPTSTAYKRCMTKCQGGDSATATAPSGGSNAGRTGGSNAGRTGGGNTGRTGGGQVATEFCAFTGTELPAKYCPAGCPALNELVDGKCVPECNANVCPSWFSGEVERILLERDKVKAAEAKRLRTFYKSDEFQLLLLIVACANAAMLATLLIIAFLRRRREKKASKPTGPGRTSP